MISINISNAQVCLVLALLILLFASVYVDRLLRSRIHVFITATVLFLLILSVPLSIAIERTNRELTSVESEPIHSVSPIGSGIPYVMFYNEDNELNRIMMKDISGGTVSAGSTELITSVYRQSIGPFYIESKKFSIS